MFETVGQHVVEVAMAFWHLWVLSAPWLVLGFVMAAVMKAYIRTETLSHLLGGSGLWDVTKAAFIGAPLPLCSCGVVPAALGLRASGASKNTTVSFLIATPETGVDSVPLTYGLMGPVMAVIRPVAAITSAIVSGLMVGADKGQEEKLASTDCCGGKKTTVPACCDEEGHEHVSIEATQSNSTMEKIKSGLAFAFGQLLEDVATWLVMGLLVAALVQVYLPADFFAGLGGGLWPMVIMALIGVPMYVCATASTPMAAGFLALGLSPGAVLVFMLLGPASNIGTLMIIKNALGARAIVGYLLGTVMVAFAFGLALDALSVQMGWDWSGIQAKMDGEHSSWWSTGIAILMALCLLRVFWLKIRTNYTPKTGDCCEHA